MKRYVLAPFATLTLALSLLIPTEQSSASDLKAPLPLSRVSSVTVNSKTKLCALFRGRTKWKPAKQVRGSVYKAISGTRAHKNACNALGGLGTVTLADLPSSSDLFRANSVASNFGISAVSGTPPALIDIPGSAIKNLFWRSGVIDGINSGTPTGEQCSELFDSPTDGTSAGFNACYMTMNAGESFATVLQSGTTLCYMKNALTQSGVTSGVVGLVSGSFPGGSITNLVSPPAGATPRVIRINAASDEGTSYIFLRIYGAETNRTAGNSYRFDYWSCDSGESGLPSDFESTRITTGGVYTSNSSGNNEAVFANTVQAFLRRVGDDLTFDLTQTRSAEVQSRSGDSSQINKSYLAISGDNTVRVKRYSNFTTETAKSYSIARVTGSDLSELRFLEGAFNEVFTRTGEGSFSHTGGVEFRDSLYASAPTNSFVSQLSAVDLTSDPFYSTLTPVSYDPTGYSCSTTPDVILSMDLAAPAFAPIQSTCEGTRLENMDFCRDTEVNNATNNFFSHCGL